MKNIIISILKEDMSFTLKSFFKMLNPCYSQPMITAPYQYNQTRNC